MAASNVNVGLGVGMSGETSAPDQIFRAQEQRDQAQQKAAAKKATDDEAALEAIRKKIIVDDEKIHRLESKKLSDAMVNSLLQINETRRTNPNDYLTQAYKILGDYRNTLNQARTRSELLFGFEDKMLKRTANQYISSSAEEARKLMTDSKTTEDWMERMKNKNIPSSTYFNYNPDNTTFDFRVEAATDPIASTTRFINQHAGDVLFTDYDPSTKRQRATFGTVRTEAEAKKIYEDRLTTSGSTAGVTKPYSGEQMAYDFFSDPEAMDQYIDRYKLQGKSEKEIVDHYLDNIYDPLAKSRYSDKTKSGLSINIQNNMGSDGQVRKFTPNEVGTVKLGPTNVTPLRRVSINEDPIQFKGNVTSNWMMVKDGKNVTPSQIKTEDLYMQEMYYFPVSTKKGRVVKVLDDSEIAALPADEVLEYKPYVIVGKKDFLTKLTDINFDKNYLVPLTDIEGDIKNQLKKTGKEDELEYWNASKEEVRKLAQSRKTQLQKRPRVKAN